MAKRIENDRAVGHLLRRAGFGPSPADAAQYRRLGFEKTLRLLLDQLDEPPPPDPKGFDPYEPGAIQQTWLDRIAAGRAPMAEKLAFFWHGHFATSNTRVREPVLMWRQYRLFRSLGAGRFETLVEAVSRDVAMIRWLDSNSNRKGTPNENYARELQELFTLGIGNYTETDVREIARAFTGWGSRHHDFVFTKAFHDDGIKTVHGRKGNFDGVDVVTILCDLPACHRFIARKLLAFFSHPSPKPGEVAELATVLQKTRGDIRAALFFLFRSPSFRAPERYRALVKSPVEFVAGALRATGQYPTPLWAHGALERMGQILFRPPSVKGWPMGAAWLTASAVVERLKVAHRLGRADAKHAARAVDLCFDGRVPPRLEAALTKASGAERIALALASPENQLC